MDSRTYWAKRSEIREAKAYSNCLETTRDLVNAYRKVGADIRREINDFYGRFATENKIDYADAVRYLNNNEVLEWRDSVEGYIEEIRKEQNPVIRERLFREYNARAYGSRITRLESLNSSIDNKLSQLYARANEQFREVLGENYTDGYYRTIYDIQNRFGYSSMFATVNDRTVDNAVSYPWSGANFSDRLWKQKADLLNQLRETLTTGFIRGESVQDMSRRIAKRFEVSQSNALRLIRTESSHIHNVAELDAYRECGFEEYEFMASLSERTCEVCGRLDGKRFKLSDKQYGVNFPPLHPNCRCTTIAFDPDDNLEDIKSGELEYEEWKREFVTERAEKLEKLSTTGENVLTNNSGSGIIKTEAFNPFPRDKVVNVLRAELEEWINNLSDEEIRALKKYTFNSADTAKPRFYERLNSMLRGDIPEDKTLQHYADVISSALKKNVLKHDFVCYRRDLVDIFAGLSEGDEFIIRSFFSTSATQSGALSKGKLCKIRVPAGTCGAYVEQLSYFPSQREFLIDKEQKYRVVSISENEIELEVIVNE